jgi:hypothetical protein
LVEAAGDGDGDGDGDGVPGVAAFAGKENLGEVQDDGAAAISSPFTLYSAFMRNRDDRL